MSIVYDASLLVLAQCGKGICMASTHDVAAEILRQYGRPLSPMKLQKLVYYSQAWQLAWTGKPLFAEPIQAWAMGPVVPELYRLHRGLYEVTDWPSGSPDDLTADERQAITSVMCTYGEKQARWLSARTHEEEPWLLAREGLPEGASSNREITQASMLRYYGGRLLARHLAT